MVFDSFFSSETMGKDPNITGTIGGSPIVGLDHGASTGDRVYKTADGNYWRELRGGVPNTLPTGARIETIKGQ